MALNTKLKTLSLMSRSMSGTLSQALVAVSNHCRLRWTTRRAPDPSSSVLPPSRLDQGLSSRSVIAKWTC